MGVPDRYARLVHDGDSRVRPKRMPRTRWLPALPLLMLGGALMLAQPCPAAPGATDLEFFEKRIRPVLVEKCYECHSAEAQARKKLRGRLRLDTGAGLLTGGD